MKTVDSFWREGSLFEFELDGTEGLGMGEGHLGSEPLGGGDYLLTFLPKDSAEPLVLASATGGGGYGRIVSDTEHCYRGDLLKVIKQVHRLGRWHGIQA